MFVESAILLQTDFRRYTNRVLVVDAPVEVRLRRVAQRDATTSEAVAKRMAEQMASADMRAKADWIVENDDSQSVITQVMAFVNTLQA